MGVVGNDWFDRVLPLDSLHVQTLTLTDVQAPFLGTPLAPLKEAARDRITSMTKPPAASCAAWACPLPSTSARTSDVRQSPAEQEPPTPIAKHLDTAKGSFRSDSKQSTLERWQSPTEWEPPTPTFLGTPLVPSTYDNDNLNNNDNNDDTTTATTTTTTTTNCNNNDNNNNNNSMMLHHRWNRNPPTQQPQTCNNK